MPFSESSAAQSHNLMKYVCEPGRVWLIPRRFGRVKQANIVRYTYPGRPHIFYARRYVVPHNPRTPAQVLMRQLFGALSRDWLGLLTPPQRDAWTALARYYNRRWGAAWIDCARQLNRCCPHILTADHRRIIRRWLVGGRPLSGQQAYVKFNSRVGRIGRPKLLWPPPPPAPFRPNPVQAVRLRWDAGRLRLELVLKRRVKGDLLVFGSAPCSAGWSTMRRPVYLGLLPVPKEGVHDITALYLARFRAPGPNQQVFLRSCQQRHGWQSAPQDHSALVPPQPAPSSPPNLNPNLNLAHRRASHCALRPPHSALRTLPLLSRSLPYPHTPCTRGTPFPRASVAANVRRRSCLACHRRKSHRRELWRGS
jgi:hypothetical protein